MTFKIHRWLSLLFGLTICLHTHAQILKPVTWSYSCKKVSENTYNLFLKAHIEKGWHLYSQHIGENGPIPTSFHFTGNPAYSLTGEVKEKGKAIKIHDPNFQMDVIYFKKEVVFVQRIKLLKAIPSIDG